MVYILFILCMICIHIENTDSAEIAKPTGQKQHEDDWIRYKVPGSDVRFGERDNP